MIVLYFVLLLLGAVCFLLEVFGTQASKINLLALGLFFWVAVPVLQSLQKL